MHIRDHSGLQITGASSAAADLFRQAIYAHHCLSIHAPEIIEQAIADSPGFVMAHVAKAHMLAVGANAEAVEMASSAYVNAANLPMNTREQGHVAALGKFFAGEPMAAGRILEDIAIDHPRDAVALQAGQMMDFLTGDSRMLRDRIARALPAWSPDQPDYHGVLSMLAFGLEEAGDYARAETAGRTAAELEPRNGWAHHAVAHVLEMQERRREGAAFLRGGETDWGPDNALAVHNWWHLALFHLGMGDTDAVLRLYDEAVYGAPSGMEFDLIDASALLWRLKLRGVDVGARWRAVADDWTPQAGVSTYAFSDMHKMMSFVSDGRRSEAQALLEAQTEALSEPVDNAIFLREVGGPATRAMWAFGEGRYAECVELLRPVRSRSARMGGSHAQRDVVDLTLIAAAECSGQTRLAKALHAERLMAKPGSASESVVGRAA